MQDIERTIVVVGAGIGGLASALALARTGFKVQLLEQSEVLKEVGAGIQLGPNVTRILSAWGLNEQLQAYAAWPNFLQVRDMLNGRVLAQKILYPDMQTRFGAPYLALHRADLQRILQQALLNPTADFRYAPDLALGQAFSCFESHQTDFTVYTKNGSQFAASVLLGADGLWSQVRRQMLSEAAPRYSGYVAYRACLQQNAIPKCLRRLDVELWMGPQMHMVVYPVRANALLNVVLVRPSGNKYSGDLEDVVAWREHSQAMPDLSWVRDCCSEVQDLVRTLNAQKLWAVWPVFDRPVLRSYDMAPWPDQAVALVGDAAHPMGPFLAQGAGMAIEDAYVLAQCLQTQPFASTVSTLALQRFAQARFRRVAKVQRQSGTKVQVYHAGGWQRWGRNLMLRAAAPLLLRQSWLYAYK